MSNFTTVGELTEEILKPFVGGIARIQEHLKPELYQGKVASITFSVPYRSKIGIAFDWMGKLPDHGTWEQVYATPLELGIYVYATKVWLDGALFLYAPLYCKSVTLFRPGVLEFDLEKILEHDERLLRAQAGGQEMEHFRFRPK